MLSTSASHLSFSGKEPWPATNKLKYLSVGLDSRLRARDQVTEQICPLSGIFPSLEIVYCNPENTPWDECVCGEYNASYGTPPIPGSLLSSRDVSERLQRVCVGLTGCIQRNDLEGVEVLVRDMGVDPNVINFTRSSVYGILPVIVAASTGTTEMVRRRTEGAAHC